MTKILLVADQDRVIDQVRAALSTPDMSVVLERDPAVAAQVAYDEDVDAVLVSMRVDAMGAVAVTRAINDAAREREPIPVTILLDREADAFLAKRSGARNWLIKTASARELRDAVSAA